jgi:FkbM family methyltransferase
MNLLRPVASLFGYDVIRKSKDILLERHLHNLFSKHLIETVIDVGANQGQYGQFLRSIGFTGVIISFEPLSDAFKTLSAFCEHDQHWHAYNFALGDAEAETVINITNYSDFSSFLEPTAYSQDTFSHKSEVIRQETVQIKVLDSIFDDLPGIDTQRIHLKMDTQGFDLNVFKGAQQHLDRIQTMQSEISIRELYEGMPDYLTALKTYTDAGFTISGLFPVTRDKNDLSVIEFDCVMVK